MYRIDTKTAYNNLDNSLLCLKTHIENKDTYWFPTWTIKNALAQVEKDFAQMTTS